jgi:hypothetical protein
VAAPTPLRDGSPIVTAVDMGYGHLRAAWPLADALGTTVLRADRPPVADPREERLWRSARRVYERASRGTALPFVGPLARRALDAVTAIAPLHPYRDQSRPSHQVRVLEGLLAAGLGSGLARRARAEGRGVVTTYFGAALAAEREGCEDVGCVITDTDLARAWVPADPARSRIRYFAPTARAVRRLRAYGVPGDCIELTGFPLPAELTGGDDLSALRGALVARLARLDTSGALRSRRRREVETLVAPLPDSGQVGPLTLTFAVGGAGAQGSLALRALRGAAPRIREGRLRLVLVAGVRGDLAARFRAWIADSGLAHLLGRGVDVLHEPDFDRYYPRFNRLLADTDVLWTKPSELVFYGALGLPLVLSPPVGVQEWINRRWAQERGFALRQHQPDHVGEWLFEWLEEGVLAAAALSGFLHGSATATARIAARLRGGS